LFRLFECCALSFFERFVLSFSLKIERFVSDSAEIWICGLYRLPEGYCQGAKGLKEEYTFLDLYLMGYTIAYPDPDPRTGFKGYAWVSGGCTDVRYLGASLEKPSFWPVEINLF